MFLLNAENHYEYHNKYNRRLFILETENQGKVKVKIFYQRRYLHLKFKKCMLSYLCPERRTLGQGIKGKLNKAVSLQIAPYTRQLIKQISIYSKTYVQKRAFVIDT